MKKLMIYTDCSFFAGCENVLENILNTKEITEKYEILYCYRFSRRYKQELHNRSIEVQTNPIRILSNDDLIVWLKDRFGKNIFYKIFLLPFWLFERLYLYHLVNFFILKRVIKKQKPDMIHINNGGYPGAESCRTMVLSAVSAGLKPILFTINNMAVKPKGLLDRYLDAFIGRNVTNFVTASKAASSRLSNHRKFPKEKLEVIHNTVLHDASINVYSPVLRDEFNLSKDHVIIGSLGLLIERKGYHYLIEAAHHIQDKDNWSIFIFGEGEERHNLEKLIEKYHLSEKVFLPGFRENPINYLLDFDAFILPSIRNEDQPNVISEAMLFSKAIISTHVAGIPEQVDHGKTGYLCKPKSIKELTESMDSIINMSPKVRLEMGKQAHEKYLNEFSYDKSMQKYFHLYNKLSQI